MKRQIIHSVYWWTNAGTGAPAIVADRYSMCGNNWVIGSNKRKHVTCKRCLRCLKKKGRAK